MPRLTFEFQEILDEIQAMKELSRDFLDPASVTIVLEQLSKSLASIRGTSRGEISRWQISDRHPLKTSWSDGSFERTDQRRRGTHKVCGVITSVWEITPSDPSATNRRLAKTFDVVGNASVCVRLVEKMEDGNERELAMWRHELGSDSSPGCYFHTQILGEDGRVDPPFPHSLPVPRLPTLAFTPMSALEFVLGEIFQDEWAKHASCETPAMMRWRPIQQKRLKQLLEWKLRLARECTGSPWIALKRGKPGPPEFPDNSRR